ncbi:hypothetical protein AB0I81_40050 [Nonomuraea sp. NPDC050404]|uniref:hypothetical protein n=1 Tax=Nonomuraea sp. NPDC050404 TaxID=3155783 RepID=UPI0033BFBBB9
MAPTPARQATIAAAIEHLRTTPPALVRRQLLDASLHAHWQRNPAALADYLARSTAAPHDFARFFGAWKGAQRVLLAAGLPWHPDDYAPEET